MPQPKNYRLELDILRTIDEFSPIRLIELSSLLYPFHHDRYKDFRSFNSHVRKRLTRYLKIRWVKSQGVAKNRVWSLAPYGEFTLKMKLSLDELVKKRVQEESTNRIDDEGGPSKALYSHPAPLGSTNLHTRL